MDIPLAETPQSITVIPAEQLRDQNAQNLQEALRYTAGVHADEYGLDNRGDWFLLRGGSQGSTLLDGLRRPLTGYYGIVRDEPFAFARMEVLRGPASVTAGQNGPGGVVNLVSKRPLDQPQSEVELQGGSYGHRQAAADLTGPMDGEGRFLYRVVALDRRSGTQVDHADQERQFLAPSFTWRPAPEASLTVFAEYQHDRSKNTEGFFPIEGTLRPGPQGFIPTSTFVSEPDWDTYGGIRTRAGVEAAGKAGDWNLRADLRHDEVTGTLRSMYANYWEGFLADGRSLNRTWYATDNRAHITNADLTAQTSFLWGPTRHKLLLGADGLWMTDSQTYLSGAATALDVYAPVYGRFTPPDLRFSPAKVTRTRNLGLFVQDQVKAGERFILLAGLRQDRARTEVDGSTAGGSEDSATSGNLGVVVQAGAGWSPYLSYSDPSSPWRARTCADGPSGPSGAARWRRG
jgi:iron complex outermembrane receptor protein